MSYSTLIFDALKCDDTIKTRFLSLLVKRQLGWKTWRCFFCCLDKNAASIIVTLLAHRMSQMELFWIPNMVLPLYYILNSSLLVFGDRNHSSHIVIESAAVYDHRPVGCSLFGNLILRFTCCYFDPMIALAPSAARVSMRSHRLKNVCNQKSGGDSRRP